MKRTALYVRVSTDAQFEEGYSVDAQRKKLEQWCTLHDIDSFEHYTDGGFSGSNLNRPAMRKMISDISAGEISQVVVYKLDRLSRSQKDTVYLLEDVFEPNGTGFISLNESFDTTTPYGKAMIGILSVFAQLERENIRERTRMGMNERITKGYWRGGGNPPYGYSYDSAKGILVPDENACNVKKIYNLYLSGCSYSRIASIFGIKGDKQVMDILSRRTYLGYILHNSQEIKGLHEPLIDEELWERVQAEREKRSVRRDFNSKYLLSGLVYCGRCGARMRYQKWGKGVKIYCYSQQKSKIGLIKNPNCDNPRVDARELEDLVVRDLISASVEYNSMNGSSRTDSVIDVLKKRLSDAQSRVRNLYNLYASSPDNILLEEIEKNKKETESILKKIDEERREGLHSENRRKTARLVTGLSDSWSFMSAEDKKRVIQICIDKIIVDGDNVDIKYNF